MPREAKAKGKQRHNPLHVEIEQDELLQKYGNVSQPGKRNKSRTRADDNEDVAGEAALDPKTSQRIFDLAKSQQEELEKHGEDDAGPDERVKGRQHDAFFQARSKDEESESEDDMGGNSGDEFLETEEYPELQVDAEDLQTLDMFLPPSTRERKTLADMIFAKLEESKAEEVSAVNKIAKVGLQNLDEKPNPAEGLNPKVVEVYSKIGNLLQRYKSGPLPKAFKIVPSLPAWARILALTRPENWSPHSTRAATRLFISNMKPAQARVYLQGVVLDAIREDIREHGKLDVHYYEALKRALYKPAAFFKGIVFPMLEGGCTLKEAAILASVIAKVKVPLVHSAAAIVRLANMDYSGPNSLFIRVLVDKKYALPYKVVDALVFHFVRLSNTYKATPGESEKLPVLWHQSLLTFAQRYSSDLTPDQKEALLDVIRASPHAQISPEIRRELVNSTVRDEPRPDADGDVAMS